MKMKTSHIFSQSGFTLLEVIVTLVIASIIGAMLIQLTGSNMSRSAKTADMVRNGFSVAQVVEEITKDYREWIVSSPDQSISVFKNTYVDPYASGDIGIQCSYADIDEGMDGGIEILRVTVSRLDENSNITQSLMTVFTK